jgi:hypothetical protein
MRQQSPRKEGKGTKQCESPSLFTGEEFGVGTLHINVSESLSRTHVIKTFLMMYQWDRSMES